MDIDEFIDREISEMNLDTIQSSVIENKDIRPSGTSGDTLFGSISSSLGSGNLEEAEHKYIQLWQILMQQNLKWNKEVYDRLSALSRQFSSAIIKSYDETNRQIIHIHELIARARAALKEGRKDLPLKIYLEIQQANNLIPKTFFEEKKAVQDDIMNFYRELISGTDIELITKVEKLVSEINQLTEKINLQIKSNDFSNAAESYGKCMEMYNQIPEGFLKEKNPAGIKLLEFYKSLSIYSEINDLHNQAGQSLPIHRMPMASPKPFVQQTPAEVPRKSSSPQRISIQRNAVYIHSRKPNLSSESIILRRKREHAKRNIKKGFYNEAWKDIEEALQLEPKDIESKVLRAKIKTLQ